MPVLIASGSAIRRALVVVAVVLGLVAMHHLVATGCSLVAGHHGGEISVSETQAGAVASPALGSPALAEESSSVQITEPSVAAAHPASTTHDHGILDSQSVTLMMCLAVLLLLVFVARSLSTARRRSRDEIVRQPASVLGRSPVAHPPDLQVLSISRT